MAVTVPVATPQQAELARREALEQRPDCAGHDGVAGAHGRLDGDGRRLQMEQFAACRR